MKRAALLLLAMLVLVVVVYVTYGLPGRREYTLPRHALRWRPVATSLPKGAGPAGNPSALARPNGDLCVAWVGRDEDALYLATLTGPSHTTGPAVAIASRILGDTKVCESDSALHVFVGPRGINDSARSVSHVFQTYAGGPWSSKACAPARAHESVVGFDVAFAEGEFVVAYAVQKSPLEDRDPDNYSQDSLFLRVAHIGADGADLGIQELDADPDSLLDSTIAPRIAVIGSRLIVAWAIRNRSDRKRDEILAIHESDLHGRQWTSVRSTLPLPDASATSLIEVREFVPYHLELTSWHGETRVMLGGTGGLATFRLQQDHWGRMHDISTLQELQNFGAADIQDMTCVGPADHASLIWVDSRARRETWLSLFRTRFFGMPRNQGDVEVLPVERIFHADSSASALLPRLTRGPSLGAQRVCAVRTGTDLILICTWKSPVPVPETPIAPGSDTRTEAMPYYAVQHVDD